MNNSSSKNNGYPNQLPLQGTHSSKGKKTFFSRLRSVLHLFFAVLLLLALLGQYLPPDYSLLPAYLGMAFPALFLLHLMSTFSSLIGGRWRSLLVKLFVVFMAAPALVTYMPLQLSQKQGSELDTDTLKVLSLNAQAFDFKVIKREEKHPTLEYINNSNADIVCLQEAFLGPSANRRVTERNIQSLCPEYRYFSHIKAQSNDGSRLAILSKYPIKNTRRLPMESLFNGGAVFDIELPNGKQLVLYNLHLESFNISSINLSKLKENLSETGEVVTEKLSPSFCRRARQVEAVVQDVKEQETDYLLVCGDLNDTPISYVHKAIERIPLTDCFAAAGKGFGFSYDLPFASFRIDHIFCSNTLIPISALVDRKAHISDHKPLAVTLVYH